MTPDDFIACGHFLYGERWQTKLAARLLVSVRTTRYWKEGRHIPEDKADAIIHAVAVHIRHDMMRIEGIYRLKAAWTLPEAIPGSWSRDIGLKIAAELVRLLLA